MILIRKALFFLALGGIAYLVYSSYRDNFTIRTGQNGRPQDVTFLHLPASASHIGYWGDGLNYCADFDITEDAFRSLFQEFHFNEITRPVSVLPKMYGDPHVPPHHSRAERISVTNGLNYAERWSNGGGYDIIFDRSRSRAYYDFAKR